ncbi:MAG: hypothetical protein H0U76_12985, partial [Ktedonobacteraceae bacterium]|nr:hypothetical protein [Ktedonobacteraceae bacterium]
MSETENIEQRIHQVLNDRDHGSSWLVREATVILHDLAQSSSGDQTEQLDRIYKSAYQIAHARPAMAALSSAMGQIVSVYQ